jgi:Icc-related predicted phosphoesterase
MTRIVCISDTHGMHGEIGKVKWNGKKSYPLPEGDILVHCGDTTGWGRYTETLAFINWLGDQDYKYKFCIAGNHDATYASNPFEIKEYMSAAGIHYLCDSGAVVDGIRFYGSPYSPIFFDWHFMEDEVALNKRFRRIPDNTDVLLTHTPPYGILDGPVWVDLSKDQGHFSKPERMGSRSLRHRVDAMPNLKANIFGHIHEGFGQKIINNTTYVNAAFLNGEYFPHGKPQPVIEIN